MTKTDVQPISSFQRDDMALSARRKRNTTAWSSARGTKAKPKGKAATRVRHDPGQPTPERLAKGDVVRMAAGHYRSPPPVERMRDRNQLDPVPHINQAMFLAAEKLNEMFLGAGLSAGAQAQDLNRVMSGSGDTPNGMPITEAAWHCRQAFRMACKLMGWLEAYPYRGAGRLTLAVVCFEQTVRDAAAIYRPGGSDAGRQAAGMDVLREGLFALAVHWKFLKGSGC